MITIGEYVSWKQPGIAQKLYRWVERMKVPTLPFWYWKKIMEEPPRPGRAGLLPWEVEKIEAQAGNL